ncbi:MAG: hypothetical protein VKK04_02380 [Synechococcales bacterium]|nr:hypothetical protein [Synechococcales bacterium]
MRKVIGIAVFFTGLYLWIVWAQSFVAMDGQRYFMIADDALISLRYGWNLAHHGELVFNLGDRVEGFTNLIWTLWAALLSLFLDKRFVPLAIQLTGLPLLLITAWNFRAISLRYVKSWDTVAFVLPLLYYPLVYWALRGMEVSLQAALVSSAVRIALNGNRSYGWLLGLAYATRPDSLVPALVVFGFRFRRSREWLIEILPFVAIAFSILVFRLYYYGEWVPNTYTLKVVGYTLAERLSLGIDYITPFIQQNFWLWPLLIASLLWRPTREKLLLSGIGISMLLYVIYVGGDGLPQHWRFLSPYVPMIFLALSLDLPYIRHRTMHVLAIAGTGSLIFLSLSLLCIYGLRGELSYPFTEDRLNVEASIVLDNVLAEDAKIAVFFAGAYPYYTEREAVDCLGKSEKYVARLKPDPNFLAIGHSKFDLDYCILQSNADAVRLLWWPNRSDELPKGELIFQGVWLNLSGTDFYFYFRKNSPHVDWSKLEQYSVQ